MLRQQTRPISLGGAPILYYRFLNKKRWRSAVCQCTTSLSCKHGPKAQIHTSLSISLVLFHNCFSAAVLNTSIYDQFVQFMCHKLVFVSKSACVCVSTCHIGCWRRDCTPGFLRFFLVEGSDKGKCEVRRGLGVLTAVCRTDGLR